MRTFLIFLLSFFCITYYVNGQITPETLRKKAVQENIINHTIQFDSVIFADISSYWKDDFKIQGIGFIKNKPYKLTINFKAVRDSNFRLEFRNLKKRKIKNKDLKTKLQDISIMNLKSLNEDSLLIVKKNNGVYMVASDGDEWSLLIVDTKEQRIFLKQLYMPNGDTKDKKLFANSIKKIKSFFKQ